MGDFDEFWICAVFLYELRIAEPNRNKPAVGCGGLPLVFTVFLNVATCADCPFSYCFDSRQHHDLQVGIKK